MTVPINPTPTSIVIDGMERALLRTPSSALITKGMGFLQEVKADIMLKAPTHPNLLVTATTVTTRGLQRYTIPEDHNVQQSITLLDGPDTYRGTSQGGSGGTIILDAALSASDDDLVGKYILITGGSGLEEYRQILTYTPGTQLVTIDNDWMSAPIPGSTYLICTQHTQLWPQDTASQFDRIDNPTTLGTPRQASLSGQEFLLYPVPDKLYGLVNRYWADLSMLDEDGPVFIQLLREWRSIFIQGVTVKTMQRYDEDRYQGELQVYNFMLDSLVPQTCRVTQIIQQP